MSDNVNHPKHYADTTSIECIEAMIVAFGRGAVVDFCKCNAFNYVWRYQNKIRMVKRTLRKQSGM